MSVFEDRRFVAALIRQVLISRLCVREAILNFPKDTEDKSIQAAFHALVHYEADEDLRARDELYREEQDDYLEFISNLLERGEDVPENIIQNYENIILVLIYPMKETQKVSLKGFGNSLM